MSTQSNNIPNFIDPDVNNFVKYCLLRGGTIKELDIPEHTSEFPGLCNPSIYNDNGNLKCILRSVNFILHNSNKPNIGNFGCTQYINRDIDDRLLKTRNFLLDIDSDLNIINYKLIEPIIDHTPQWEFVGEEDMRLFRWNSKLYGCGVVRDDNSTGVGRMRLSRLSEKNYQEISQIKLDDSSYEYCEKNWVPILDLPYHFIRNTYPDTEIIRVDPKKGTCRTIINQPQHIALNHDMMLRGSSQVLKIDNYYISLVHSCNLYFDYAQHKYARYYHQFVIWDADWNIIKVSRLFSFSDHNIEFSNGMCEYDNNIIISFAISDNSAYLLKFPKQTLKEFIECTDLNFNNSYCNISLNNDESFIEPYWYFPKQLDYINRKLSRCDSLFKYQLYIDAYEIAENISDKYNYLFYASRIIANYGERDNLEIFRWLKQIELCSYRPEGYAATAMYYYYRENYSMAAIYAKFAYKYINNLKIFYNKELIEKIYVQCLLSNGELTSIEQYKETYPELFNIQEQFIRIL